MYILLSIIPNMSIVHCPIATVATEVVGSWPIGRQRWFLKHSYWMGQQRTAATTKRSNFTGQSAVWQHLVPAV